MTRGPIGLKNRVRKQEEVDGKEKEVKSRILETEIFWKVYPSGDDKVWDVTEAGHQRQGSQDIKGSDHTDYTVSRLQWTLRS